MKKLIIAFALAAGFSACNRSTDTRDIQIMNDSAAYINDMYSDRSSDMEIVATPASQSRSVKSVLPRTTTKTTSATRRKSSSANSSETTRTTTRKKGWSSAAKGAVIGAGAGAVGGAIIGKKAPVKGAVIGGVVGAAGGYIIGRDIDKKKGR